jgi:hypothetical protein
MWYLEDLDDLEKDLDYQLSHSDGLTYNWLCDYLHLERIAMGNLPIQHNHVTVERLLRDEREDGYERYMLLFRLGKEA